MKKGKKLKAIPKVDPFIEGLMGKLLDRLTNLEKKMDTVISKVSSKSSGGGEAKPALIQEVKLPKRDRTMYEAICADCSKVCEVPFRPTENRPVYCKECWAKRKGGGHSAMPIIRPVAAAPRTESKLGMVHVPQVQAVASLKKSKKSAPAKKAKKKK